MIESHKDWSPEHHPSAKLYSFSKHNYDKEILYKSLVRASERTRTVGFCTAEKCSNKIWEDTPLCKEHAYDMWKKVEVSKEIDAAYAEYEYQEYIDRAEQRYEDALEKQRLDDAALKAEWQRKAEAEEQLWNSKRRPGHIYYLQVGKLVKIGFSSYLDERLRAYPPDSQVLATHPGTPELEQHIHRKFFNHLSHGREWFTPSTEIDQHIQEVREQFPQHNKI